MNNFVAILLFIFSLIVVYFYSKLQRRIFKWAMGIMNPPDLPEGEEE